MNIAVEARRGGKVNLTLLSFQLGMTYPPLRRAIDKRPELRGLLDFVDGRSVSRTVPFVHVSDIPEIRRLLGLAGAG